MRRRNGREITDSDGCFMCYWHVVPRPMEGTGPNPVTIDSDWLWLLFMLSMLGLVVAAGVLLGPP